MQMIYNNIESGSWANMNEILPIALSRAMNISLVIIRSDGAIPNIYRRPQNLNENDRPIIYIGNEVDWHFQSLEPLEGQEAEKNRELLKVYFENTKVDVINYLNRSIS